MTLPKDPTPPPFLDGVFWASVVTSVILSLTVSAYILSQHSQQPHPGAASPAEINRAMDRASQNRNDLTDIRQDIRRIEQFLLREAAQQGKSYPKLNSFKEPSLVQP